MRYEGRYGLRVALIVGCFSVADLLTPALALGESLRLSLADAIERAAGATTEVSEGRRDLSLAKAEAVRSGVWLPSDPQISVGAYHSTIKEDVFNDDGELIDRRGYGPNYTFSISQELEIAGQRGLRVEAAGKGTQRARLALRFQKENLVALVRTAFVHALAEGEKLAVAQQASEAMQGLVLSHRGEAERADASELLTTNQLRIQQALARNQIAQAQRSKNQALGALRRLCRIPDNEEIELIGQLDPHVQDLAGRQELVRRGLSNRVDLAALQKGLEAADASLTAKQRARIPNLTVSASVSQFAGATLAGGEITAPVPLFFGNAGDVEEVIADRNESARALDLLKAEISKEVSDAYEDCVAAAASVRAYHEEILPLHEDNVRLQRRLVSRGDADVSDLMGVLIDFGAARMDAVGATEEYHTAQIELRRVVGADVQPLATTDDNPGSINPASLP